MRRRLWRGQLFVHKIEGASKYKDIVRVSQTAFIVDKSKPPVLDKNHVYRMRVKGKSVIVALRGSYRNGISTDKVTREQLGIDEGRSYHFEFQKVGWVGQFLWAWNATDPAYRIASRLGALSLGLGLLGVLLGGWSLILAMK